MKLQSKLKISNSRHLTVYLYALLDQIVMLAIAMYSVDSSRQQS